MKGDGKKKIAKFLSYLALGCGLFITLCDLLFSYRGWGIVIAEYLGGSQEMRVLAFVLSALPQIVQMATYGILSAETSAKTEKGLKILGASCFVGDTALDTIYLIQNEGAKPFAALVITVIVFGVLSEMLIMYFGGYIVAGHGIGPIANVSSKFKRPSGPSMTRPMPG
jgi:hypothetical protein